MKKPEKKTSFPKSPDWSKVEKTVTDMLIILNKGEDLTYMEKFNVLAIIQHTINKEMSVNAVIDWFQYQVKEEMKQASKVHTPGTG